MPLTLITPPSVLPMSLAEAKAAARIEGDEDDALVAGHIRSAVDHLDGPSGMLGIAMMRQTWQLTLDCFATVIGLPLPPLAEVLSVSYLDATGDPQTLDPADYIVAGVGGDGSIRPALGRSFPATAALPDAVTVRFVAGVETWNDVPQPLRSAIAELVRSYYDGCDAGPAVKELIMPYRASWTF